MWVAGSAMGSAHEGESIAGAAGQRRASEARSPRPAPSRRRPAQRLPWARLQAGRAEHAGAPLRLAQRWRARGGQGRQHRAAARQLTLGGALLGGAGLLCGGTASPKGRGVSLGAGSGCTQGSCRLRRRSCTCFLRRRAAYFSARARSAADLGGIVAGCSWRSCSCNGLLNVVGWQMLLSPKPPRSGVWGSRLLPPVTWDPHEPSPLSPCIDLQA